MKDPKVLRELWAIKEQAWREVEHLGLKEGIRKRLDDSRKTAEALGYEPTEDGKYLRKRKSA